MYQDLDDLIGKVIHEVRIDPENTEIQFITDEEVLSYYTYGECCSESWIQHISGLQALIGERVLKVDEIEMPEINDGEEGFSGRQYVDKIYSYKMFTGNGVCELEMRNASNGYYGGSLQKVDKIPHELKPLHKDF